MTINHRYKFVFANKDTVSLNDILLEKNDVGILEDTEANIGSIYFIRSGQKADLRNTDYQPFDVKKTGDAFSKKVCNVCHKILDTDVFAKNQSGKGDRAVRRPSCSKCRKLIDGNKIKTKQKKEWGKTKPKYKPFKCPVCLKRTIPLVTSKIVLDHDHVTGKARGWICDSCNTGLGRFKDDVGLLERAIEYLKEKSDLK